MSLTLWDDALAGLAARPGHEVPQLRLRREDGSCLPLALDSWHGPLDGCDRTLLQRLLSEPGPVLDVGCGPGRLAAAAAAAGLPSLGIDVAPSAVLLARARGASAARVSVFDDLPEPGPWRHVLLADGNVGIGGDVVALLRRCADLLAPGGAVHAEAGPPGGGHRSMRVRLERSGGPRGEWFRWAEVSTETLGELASAASLSVRSVWTVGSRWYCELRRPA